nr:immunoglobulin light chain junction region [Macaca mulatta]MOW43796.1 immunoglobulin light chain junction region [Macaca mulatta]
CQQDSDWSLTF